MILVDMKFGKVEDVVNERRVYCEVMVSSFFEICIFILSY